MNRWRIFGGIKYTEDSFPDRDYIEHRNVVKVIKYEDWDDSPFALLKLHYGRWIVVYDHGGYDWCKVQELSKLEKALK